MKSFGIFWKAWGLSKMEIGLFLLTACCGLTHAEGKRELLPPWNPAGCALSDTSLQNGGHVTLEGWDTAHVALWLAQGQDTGNVDSYAVENEIKAKGLKAVSGLIADSLAAHPEKLLAFLRWKTAYLWGWTCGGYPGVVRYISCTDSTCVVGARSLPISLMGSHAPALVLTSTSKSE